MDGWPNVPEELTRSPRAPCVNDGDVHLVLNMPRRRQPAKCTFTLERRRGAVGATESSVGVQA